MHVRVGKTLRAMFFLLIIMVQMFTHFSMWFIDFIFGAHFRVEGSPFSFLRHLNCVEGLSILGSPKT